MTLRQGSYCFAQLPRAGLGNKLFVWARGAIFAHLNSLPLVVSRWSSLSVGSILRRERIKRSYSSYFNDTSAVAKARQFSAWFTHTKVREPSIRQIANDDKSGKVFVFDSVPHWSDYFAGIKEYREYISSELLSMLNKDHRVQLNKLPPPVIGVHVRMGDFRRLQPDEEFKEVGHVRTPLTYFIDLIELIRDIHGTCLPVTIFSDGYDEELTELLRLPKVARLDAQSDIVEMLLLAKSKLIITSAGSTFSYWSGFLANAPVVIHYEHIHDSLRPDTVNQRFFEGGVDVKSGQYPALFIENVKALASF